MDSLCSVPRTLFRSSCSSPGMTVLRSLVLATLRSYNQYNVFRPPGCGFQRSSRHFAIWLLCRILPPSVPLGVSGSRSPATAASGVAMTTGRGASASPSTAELRESMSLAVSAIATQSAQLLLQNNKVCEMLSLSLSVSTFVTC